MVKTHLGTIPTALKRKALEKPTRLVNSGLVINICLQARLIKRCLISIFQQFCFVSGLCAAGRSRICLGCRGKGGNPRPAPPRLPSTCWGGSIRCVRAQPCADEEGRIRPPLPPPPQFRSYLGSNPFIRSAVALVTSERQRFHVCA